MKYDPKIHHRRSIRLKGYDYSKPGAYFVTIRIQNGRFFCGAIVGDVMQLNGVGLMVQEEWEQLPERFPIELDVYVVMPNHFHAIVIIIDDNIREYILTNPLRWTLDRENPEREGEDEFDRWLFPDGQLG